MRGRRLRALPTDAGRGSGAPEPGSRADDHPWALCRVEASPERVEVRGGERHAAAGGPRLPARIRVDVEEDCAAHTGNGRLDVVSRHDRPPVRPGTGNPVQVLVRARTRRLDNPRVVVGACRVRDPTGTGCHPRVGQFRPCRGVPAEARQDRVRASGGGAVPFDVGRAEAVTARSCAVRTGHPFPRAADLLVHRHRSGRGVPSGRGHHHHLFGVPEQFRADGCRRGPGRGGGCRSGGEEERNGDSEEHCPCYCPCC